MKKWAIWVWALGLLPALAWAQTHSSQLPPLTPQANFPRCTEQQLAVAGYPDHQHAQHWPDWQVLKDAAGVPYGPGSLCANKKLIAHDDMVVQSGEIHYQQFSFYYNPEYTVCDMLGWVELMTWAQHDVTALLGLSTPDTLIMHNPDNTDFYKEQTGCGVWRLYDLKGNKAILESYPVLMMRTLDGHAAFMLMTDWLLQRALPVALPRWLQQGLVEYIGEDGTHLFSYVGEFRAEKSILMSAPLVDALLTNPRDRASMEDRETFRRACYSAFLMVWQLVEYEGGIDSLQDFLGRIAGGTDPDDAARSVYGANLTQLASLVDAVQNGEPAGKTMRQQRPHIQP